MTGKLYRIIKGFGRQMSRANVSAYASSTAFFLFLSLIPMVMLICSIIPYTPLKESDLMMAAGMLPDTVSPLLVSMILSFYDSTFAVVSLSAIVTVWSAGKGVLALMRGLNAMNCVVEDRNYFLQRIIASFYLIVFLITIIFSLTIMVFGNVLADTIVRYVPRVEDLFSLLVNLKGIFSWCVLTLIFTVMYTFIPNCKLRFKSQFPGAVFSSTTWSIFSWGFSVYVENFNGFDMYGSLTTIVIVMLWMYFCFYLFLIGAHLNRFLIPFHRVSAGLYTRTDRNTEAAGRL